MTLIGIGPFWLYQSIFFYFSLSPKVNQADETLRRIYNRNCQTLSINSAGKHHRGFYPSRCSRNCSILFEHTGHAHLDLSKHQPLWIFLPSFQIITITQLWPSNFRWITDETYHVVSCPWINACASINISAIYVANCWLILLQFRLGNLCSCCFICICP